MGYRDFDFEPVERYTEGRSYTNRLVNPHSGNKETIQSTVDKLNLSIKYFEHRIADYQKAANGAAYFLNQLTSGKEMFDEASKIYWSIAFDPCAPHAKDIFLSLDTVFEALRDKFISLELGQ